MEFDYSLSKIALGKYLRLKRDTDKSAFIDRCNWLFNTARSNPNFEPYTTRDAARFVIIELAQLYFDQLSREGRACNECKTTRIARLIARDALTKGHQAWCDANLLPKKGGQ